MNKTTNILFGAIIFLLLAGAIGLFIWNVNTITSLNEVIDRMSSEDSVIERKREATPVNDSHRIEFGHDGFQVPGGYDNQRPNESGSFYLPVWRFESPDGRYAAIKYFSLQGVSDMSSLIDVDNPYFEGGGYIQIISNFNEDGERVYGQNVPILVERKIGPYTLEKAIEWISNESLLLDVAGGEGGSTYESTYLLHVDGEIEVLYTKDCAFDECTVTGDPSLYNSLSL
jgi:hypothetical protein